MINESLLQPDTPSALDICNAALSKIGEAPLDALIANESTASRLCVLHYHPARRETLCMARWTFAATQTTLDSVSAQAPNSLTPYQFTLPADCLRVLDVECILMKALDFIQIFASNVRRLDFRLSSAQVILAVIAGYRRHSTITEATRLHPNTVTNILQDLIAQGYVNRIGDGRPYVYRPTADGEQLAGNLLDKNTFPGT